VSIIFLPKSEELLAEIAEINQKLAEGISFEALIVSLAEWDRKIHFLPGNDPQGPEIIINIEHKEEAIAFAATSFIELFGKKRTAELFPEQMQKFADMDGYTADIAWFQERNERLKAKWNDNEELWVFPARAVREITLSYLLSSGGMACFEKQIFSDHRHYPFQGYLGHFVFFGEGSQNGWSEKMVVYKNRLDRHAERKIAVQNKPADRLTVAR
jgi:hypothetical protein